MTATMIALVAGAIAYPETRIQDLVETLHDVEVADSYPGVDLLPGIRFG